MAKKPMSAAQLKFFGKGKTATKRATPKKKVSKKK
jgi:hypothetical protein